MSNLESVVFGNKKFSDILSEIYDNQKKKEKQISTLIGELKPLINDIGDATLIVPLIKEYLDVAVKNDDHLVKLTAIVQRYISTKQTIAGADSLLSDEEKMQLIRMAETTLETELTDEIEDLRNMDLQEKALQNKIDQAKQKLSND